MLYEKYEQKVYKFANILKIIKRFRVLIITGLVAIFALVASLLAVSGNVSEISFPQNNTTFNYGDSYESLFEAKATFKKVGFEYRQEGSSEWSTTPPTIAGNFDVRAYSKGAFGVKKYGNIHSYTIVSRPIYVTLVANQTIEYGETPQLKLVVSGDNKDFVKGDSFDSKLINCNSFTYSDRSKSQTDVSILKDNIKITNNVGNDVTGLYSIQYNAEPCSIAFTPKEVKVKLLGNEKEFDGTALSNSNYDVEALKKQLVFDDAPGKVIDAISITNVLDSKRNDAKSVVITSKNFGDVSSNYSFDFSQSESLIITPRAVSYKTIGKEFTYNNEAFSYSDSSAINITKGSLVSGHRFKAITYSEITNVGSQSNEISLSVIDEQSQDVSSNYQVTCSERGILKVNPLSITLTSSDNLTKVYDGLPYTGEASSPTPNLLFGRTATFSQTQSNSAFGTYDIAVSIKDNYGDYTNNYSINYTYKNINITKRPLTIKARDISSHTYDGYEFTERAYDIISGTLADGETENVLYNPLTCVDAGSYVYSINKELVTISGGVSNYDITYIDGTITINKRDISFKPVNITTVYDGVSHSATDYEVTSLLPLPDNHKVEAIYLGSVENVTGFNPIVTSISSLKIKNSSGIDVTDKNFNVKTNSGTIEITSRPITIQLGSGQFTYDGDAHFVDNYQVINQSAISGLAPNQAITVSNVQSFSDVNYAFGSVQSYTNSFDIDITKDGGVNTENNYTIDKLDGTVTINQRNIQIETKSVSKVYDSTPLFYDEVTVKAVSPLSFALVTGHNAVSNGDYASITETKDNNTENTLTVSIYNGSIDKTNNYNIIYVYGRLNIIKRNILVTTGSLSKMYDGAELSCDSFDVKPDASQLSVALVGGEQASANLDLTTIVNVRESGTQNKFTVSISSGFNDKTNNYEIRYLYGTLTITKRPITIKPLDDEAIFYDGVSHLPTATVVSENSENQLVSGHEVEAQITADGNVTDVASYVTSIVPNSYVIKDGYTVVTDNYDVNLENGVVRIYSRDISIKPVDSSKVYDGTPLVATEFEYVYPTNELPNGFSFSIVYGGTITDVGRTSSTIVSWQAYNNGVLINSENFNVTTTSATLEITARNIRVQLGSGEFTYDGNNHSVSSYDVLNQGFSSGLATNQTIEVSNVQSFVNVNRDNFNTVIPYTNNFDIDIIDSREISTKSNYTVSIQTGEVLIKPLELKITTNSARKVYDGTPLTDVGMKIEPQNGLFGTHTARIYGDTYPSIIYYSNTPVVNQFDVRIYENATSNVEVTTNYEIEMKYGTLEILKLDIYVSTDSKSFIYDGNSHSHISYNLIHNDMIFGDVITVDENATIKYVTEGIIDNRITLKFKNSSNLDITDSYNVIATYGKLTVTPRPIAVKANDLSKSYDGTPLSATAYDLTDVSLSELGSTYEEYGLPAGHTLSATFVGSRVNVNSLTENDSEINKIVNGSVIVKADVDLTNNFEVVRYLDGTLTINPIAISIAPENVLVDYDGKEHSPTKIVVTNDSQNTLVDGDFVIGETVGSATEITQGITTYITEYTIVRANNLVVSSNYIVELKNGTIVINKRRITIETGSGSWVYDGQEHFNNSEPTITEDSPNSLITNHTITVSNFAKVTEVEQTTENNNTCDIDIVDEFNNSVLNNYDVTTKFGTLEITKRDLELSTVGGYYIYDGIEHTFEVISLVNEFAPNADVVDGQEKIVSDWTTIKNVLKNSDGSYKTVDNKVTVTVRDIATQADKTSNYNIKITYGQIHIESRILDIQTTDESFIYDGEIHNFDNYFSEFETELAEGVIETIKVGTNIDFVDVAQAKPQNNVFEVNMLDANNNDVSENYIINYVYGTVTVTARNISIKAEDTTVYYNGLMNYCAGIDETSGVLDSGLVANHKIVVTSCDQGSIVPTETPIACRVKDFGIVDSNEKNVMGNYNVTISGNFGYLTVLARPIIITPYENPYGQTYDGKIHNPIIAYASGEFGLVKGDILTGKTYYTYFNGELVDAINVGIYKTEVDDFEIRNASNEDVTACYSVTRQDGTLTITQKTLEIEKIDVEFTYDGKLHSGVLPEIDVIEGQFYDISEAVSYSEVKDSGKLNEFTIAIYLDEEHLIDVTSNYDIKYNYGKFIINKKSVNILAIGNTWVYDGYPHSENYAISEYCGLITELGHHFDNIVYPTVTNVEKTAKLNKLTSYKIYDAASLEVDIENYMLEYTYDEAYQGLLTITPRKITVQTATSGKVYNGKSQSDDTLTLETGTLADSQVLAVLRINTRLTDVSSEANDVLAKVVDANDSTIDYSTNYEISYNLGTFSINPRDITIKLQDKTTTYNGEIQYCDVGIDDTNLSVVAEGGLVNNQKIFINLIAGGGIYYSEVPYDCEIIAYSIMKGTTDVTNNYNVTVDWTKAKLTINKLDVSIRPEIQTKTYNGEIQTPDNFSYVAGSQRFVDSDILSFTYSTSEEAKNVGSYTASIVSYTAIDNDGVDVSECYNVDMTRTSTFKITKKDFNISTDDFTAVYNGLPQSETEAYFDQAQLVPGDGLMLSNFVTSTDVIKTTNSVDVTFVDFGEDVTANYNIIKSFGIFEITKKQINVVAVGNTWEYDGDEHSQSYEIAEDSGLLTALGHHFDSVVYKTITDVPNQTETILNTFKSYDILDQTGKSIKGNYEIVYTFDSVYNGVLTITPRTITIQTQTAEYTYNGQNNYANSYTIDNLISGSLVEGHKINIWSSTAAKNVEVYANIWDVKIFDGLENEKTKNYNIIYQNGTITILARRIVITAQDQEKVYNGAEQTCDSGKDITVVADGEIAGLVDGHTIQVVSCTGGGTIPGEYPCTVSGFVIKNGNEDVSLNYSVTTEGYSGTLTIIKREIQIRPNFKSFEYTGSVVTLGSGDFVFYNSANRLVSGDNLTVVISIDGGKNVGRSTTHIDSYSITNSLGDVTDCYDVKTVDYYITITQKALTVTTGNVDVVYDGTAHSNVNVDCDGLIDGHEVVYGQFKTVTNVSDGVLENSVDITINDENNEDVTANYNINRNFGSLKVTQRELTVYVNGASWEYDGQYHSTSVNATNYYSYDNKQLASGQKMIIGEWISVKDHQVDAELNVTNGFAYTFKDKQNNPVENDNYKVIFDGSKDTTYNGKLLITPIKIFVTTGTESWIYDGYEHINKNFEFYTTDSLNPLSSDFWTQILTNEFLMVGNSKNDYTKVINVVKDESNILKLYVVDENKDTLNQNNYEFHYTYGKLTIEQRKITVKAIDCEVYYNGLPQSSFAGEAMPATTENDGLVQGHKVEIQIVYDANRVAPGTYACDLSQVVVYDLNGNNVSENYDIDKTSTVGQMKINPRPIIVFAKNLEKVYDGTEISYAGYEREYEQITTSAIDDVDALVGGHYIVVTSFTGSQINVGESDNIINSIKIFDANDQDVTAYYAPNFENGKLKVTIREIKINTLGAEKTYDAMPLEQKEYSIVSGELVNDDQLSVTAWTTQTDATNNLGVKNELTVVVVDVNGVENTNYVVSISEYGKLKISKRIVYVDMPTGSTSTFVYDGEYHMADVHILRAADLASETGLVVGHSLNVTKSTRVKDAGVYKNIILSYNYTDSNGDEISSSNYTLKQNDGLAIEECALTITQRAIVVSAEDLTVTYTGKLPIMPTAVDATPASAENSGLVSGHTIKITSIAGVGKDISSNVDSYQYLIDGCKIYSGSEVTQNYSITFDTQSKNLTIEKRSITIKPIAVDIKYDGEEHTPEGVEVVDGELCVGHSITSFTFTPESTVTQLGNYPTKATAVVIEDEVGDVTDNYEITFEDGVATIGSCKLVITLAGAEKIYDGTPISMETGYFVTGLLGTDQVTEISGFASITNVGTLRNNADISTVVINNAIGDVVTGNYEISIDANSGYLKITKRTVNITTLTGNTFEYDGNSHSQFSGYTFGTEQDTGLVLDHTIVDNSIVWTTIKGVGEKVNRFTCDIYNGIRTVDESDNYQLNFTDDSAKLVVIPTIIKVKPTGKTVEYDGKTQTITVGEIIEENGKTMQGLGISKIEIVCKESYIEPSVTPYVLTIDSKDNVVVYDSNNSVCNDNFTIQVDSSYSKGNLTITTRSLEIAPELVNVPYDGLEHSPSKIEIISGSLVDGHYFDDVVYSSASTATEPCDNVVTGIESFVIRDENDADVTSKYYTIQSSSSTITITKRTLNLTTNSGIWSYDGDEHSDNNYVISETCDGLLDSHEIIATNWASITFPGTTENSVDLQIVLKGTNISAEQYYEIETTFGDFVVGKRQILITTTGYTWEYDGLEHSFESEYTVASGLDTGLVGADIILTDSIVWTSKITDYTVNGVNNVFTCKIMNGTGSDAIDVSEYYELSFTDNESTRLYINKLTIDMASGDGVWTYDGLSHKNVNVNYDETKMPQNHMVTVTKSTSVKEVKIVDDNVVGVENAMSIIIERRNGDGSTSTATNNFIINWTNGSLVVNKRQITIKPTDETAVYDGNKHFSTSAEIAADSLYSLVYPHTITVECNGDGRTEPGFGYCYLVEGSAVIMDGTVDVTKNYIIKYSTESARITITKRTITVKPLDVSITYDGTSHSAIDWEYVGDSLDVLAIHSVTATYNGSATDYTETPISSSFASFKIFADGKDVSMLYYTIVKQEGTITINKRDITIATEDEHFIFDGLEHLGSKHNLPAPTQLVDGHTVEVVFTPIGITNTNENRQNTLSSVAIKNGAVDVSGNYKFNYQFGDLVIDKRDVNVTIYGQSFIYDGQSHSYSNQYSIETSSTTGIVSSIGDELIIGEWHTVKNVIDNKLNGFSYTIENNRNDVKDNYNVQFVTTGDNDGWLKIIPIDLTIKTDTNINSMIFNGKPQSDSGTSIDYIGGSFTALNTLPNEQFITPESTLATVTYVTDGEVTNEFSCSIYEGELNVSDNYNITYVYGKIAVIARKITVKPKDTTNQYNGTAQSITVGQSTNDSETTGIVSGHTIKVDCLETATLPDESVSSIVNRAYIFDALNIDRTLNYEINTNGGTGTITITKRVLKLIANSNEKPYDGTELIDGGSLLDTTANDGFGCLIGTDSITVNVVGTITEVGSVANVIDSYVFTGNEEYYDIQTVNGTLTITARIVTINTKGKSKIYDGTRLTCEEWEYAEGSNQLLDGHTFELNFKYCETATNESDIHINAGTKSNTLNSYKIMNGNIDVTNQYNLNLVFGNLSITRRNIYIKTSSQSWIYDGTAHYADDTSIEEVMVNDAGLLPGHKLVVTTWSNIKTYTRNGVVNRPLVWNVEDENGNNVRNNYMIPTSGENTQFGKLYVTQRTINISIVDCVASYDGTKKTCTEVQVNELLGSGEDYGLADGDYIVVTWNGGGVEVGKYECAIASIAIRSELNRTVTTSYVIKVDRDLGYVTIQEPII